MVNSVATESTDWKQVRKDADTKTSWSDVHLSIELKAFRVIESSPLDQATSEKQVLGSSVFLIQLRILISDLTLLAASSTPASDTLQYSDYNSKVERRLTSQASGPFTGAASEKKRVHAEAEGGTGYA